jgi:hypothetical protein
MMTNIELALRQSHADFRDALRGGVEYWKAKQKGLATLHRLLYGQRSSGHGIAQRFVKG